jgi:hypothetical protein
VAPQRPRFQSRKGTALRCRLLGGIGPHAAAPEASCSFRIALMNAAIWFNSECRGKPPCVFQKAAWRSRHRMIRALVSSCRKLRTSPRLRRVVLILREIAQPRVVLVEELPSLRSMAELLGHRGLRMVMRYAHLSPTYLSAEVGLLDPPAPAPPPPESRTEKMARKGQGASKRKQRSAKVVEFPM